MRRSVVLLAAVIGSFVLSGCGEEQPRTREQLFLAERDLPTLYIGAKTGKRVIAPDKENVVYDEESQELCWKAQACHNPDCPGREGKEIYLFVTPSGGAYRKPDGTMASSKNLALSAKPDGPHVSTSGRCPKCNQVKFVKQHILPETAEKLKTFEEERRRRAKIDLPQEE